MMPRASLSDRFAKKNRGVLRQNSNIWEGSGVGVLPFLCLFLSVLAFRDDKILSSGEHF